MNKGIELEIFFADDQFSTFDKVGMEYKLIDCPSRKVTYYNISAISPYLDGADENKQYCRIHCNDTDFICVNTYYQVKAIINLANKLDK